MTIHWKPTRSTTTGMAADDDKALAFYRSVGVRYPRSTFVALATATRRRSSAPTGRSYRVGRSASVQFIATSPLLNPVQAEVKSAQTLRLRENRGSLAVDTPSWSQTEIAYLAGIIDGEGCFCLHDQGSHKFSCQLQIGNTDLRLLQWIRTTFGGSVNYERRHNPKHKVVWRWLAHQAEIDHILPAIMPFLIVKKNQAELMLAYRATLAPRINKMRSTRKTPEHVKRTRADIHSQLAVLNRRGA